MKIAVIPIDNRPICYDLIKDILDINSDIELFMPDIKDLGGLNTSSNVENIFKFLKNLPETDFLIASLDTVAYGGLITSRRCKDDFKTIKKRIEDFRNTVSQKKAKVLAFSSIMRISNNNINEEEKEYWAQYGKMIFDWSYNLHKSEFEHTKRELHSSIPVDILEDYLQTRKRNFKINKIYLDWAKEGFFDTLIFSKDDCAQYGLNVKEALEFEDIIIKENIKNALIKTGADEIPLSLLTRALSRGQDIKIKPLFSQESYDLISKYEDISIKDCALGQLSLAGVEIREEGQDLALLINNFKDEQGDLVLGDIINTTDENIDFPDFPYFIADVNNANGADCGLVEQLFKQNSDNFFGYCGYNTSANTLGCAIAAAISKFVAQKNNSYNPEAFKKLQFIRLLDDWGYQAINRKYVRENAPNYSSALREKERELNLCAEKISHFLSYFPKNLSYSLPWDRSFEVRINL